MTATIESPELTSLETHVAAPTDRLTTELEPAPPVSAVVGLLGDAADLLETGGWCQNLFAADDGSHCLAGAISKAWGLGRFATVPRLGFLAEEAVEDYLGIQSIVGWNDADGRTKEEVVTALRGAAKEITA